MSRWWHRRRRAWASTRDLAPRVRQGPLVPDARPTFSRMSVVPLRRRAASCCPDEEPPPPCRLFCVSIPNELLWVALTPTGYLFADFADEPAGELYSGSYWFWPHMRTGRPFLPDVGWSSLRSATDIRFERPSPRIGCTISRLPCLMLEDALVQQRILPCRVICWRLQHCAWM